MIQLAIIALFGFCHAIQETIRWNRAGSRLEGKYWKNFELQQRIEKNWSLLAYFIIPFIDGYHMAGTIMVLSVLAVGYVSLYVDWEITGLPLDIWFPIIWMVVYGLAFEYSYNWLLRKKVK